MSRCGSGNLTGAFSPRFHAFYFDPPGTPRHSKSAGSFGHTRISPSEANHESTVVSNRYRKLPVTHTATHVAFNANRIDDPIPPESLGSTPASICPRALALRGTNRCDIADVILLQFHIHQASRPTPRTNQDNRIDQRTHAKQRYFAPLCGDSE